jgi:hypothetical protein
VPVGACQAESVPGPRRAAGRSVSHGHGAARLGPGGRRGPGSDMITSLSDSSTNQRRDWKERTLVTAIYLMRVRNLNAALALAGPGPLPVPGPLSELQPWPRTSLRRSRCSNVWRRSHCLYEQRRSVEAGHSVGQPGPRSTSLGGSPTPSDVTDHSISGRVMVAPLILLYIFINL